MIIHEITEPLFKEYGKVITGYDTKELVRVLDEVTPLPAATEYVPEQPELQALPIAKEFSDRLYGGMPVQLGWCNGHNTTLNCLEYHRDSEINLGVNDFILLLGKESQIDDDGMFDTANIVAFKVPTGVLVEVYATTLHYAPCGRNFRVIVGLPAGTNTEKPEIDPVTPEDKYLWARNKWLLAHKDTAEAKQGACIGISGENIDICGSL